MTDTPAPAPPRHPSVRTIAIAVICVATIAAAILHGAAMPARSTLTLEAIEGGVPLAEIASTPAPMIPPFDLVRADGVAVSEADMRGRVTLLFFGFTHCPDVCPTALAALRTVRTGLGAVALARTQLWFVTVDPERDTAERLRDYAGAIDPAIVALRGDVAAVRALATPLGISFGALYPAAPSTAGHDHAAHGTTTAAASPEIAHTTAILLIDKDGAVRRSFAPPYDTAAIQVAVSAWAEEN